ncbi:MAG: ferrous iron transport protein A [Pirellula sp.]
MTAPNTTLLDLQLGERAVITEIDGNDAIAARLLEMGLLPGEITERIGSAPMGDPIEFSVVGYRLSLRKAECARVRIEKV